MQVDISALAIFLKRVTFNESLDTFFTSMTWKSSGEGSSMMNLKPDPREHDGEGRTIQRGLRIL
jgi:hypothetical protein